MMFLLEVLPVGGSPVCVSSLCVAPLYVLLGVVLPAAADETG